MSTSKSTWFSADILEREPHLWIKVIAPRKKVFFNRYFVYYLLFVKSHLEDFKNLHTNDFTVFVSFGGLNPEYQNIIIKKECMWFDLKNYRRIGSNGLGVELAKFFKHFGIRFDRSFKDM